MNDVVHRLLSEEKQKWEHTATLAQESIDSIQREIDGLRAVQEHHQARIDMARANIAAVEGALTKEV